MTTLKPRTTAEINHLITEWCNDPYWVLQDTEGFEYHRDQLAEFAAAVLAYKDNSWRQRLDNKVKELGLPGNLLLAAYVLRLEDRISALENRVV